MLWEDDIEDCCQSGPNCATVTINPSCSVLIDDLRSETISIREVIAAGNNEIAQVVLGNNTLNALYAADDLKVKIIDKPTSVIILLSDRIGNNQNAIKFTK